MLVVIRRLLAAASGVLALLAGAACTTAPPAPRAAAPASRAAPHHRVSLAGRHRPASNAAGTITLAFAGDVNFAGRTRRLLADPATAFGPITGVLRSADFSAVNLETAITGGGTPQPKTYHSAPRHPPSPRCATSASRRMSPTGTRMRSSGPTARAGLPPAGVGHDRGLVYASSMVVLYSAWHRVPVPCTRTLGTLGISLA